ncbi:hypothetical protein HYW36_00100 [Candidatus Saccharibacteria bacterium]|nr:hypothetical protein [Candidatus Saccharibacteria bacterium]
MNRYSPPKPSTGEIFFTDAERLQELIRIHKSLLDGEASGAPRLIETLSGAESILGFINLENQRKLDDPSYRGPAILHMEMDASQTEALRLARRFSSTVKRGIGATVLRG